MLQTPSVAGVRWQRPEYGIARTSEARVRERQPYRRTGRTRMAKCTRGSRREERRVMSGMRTRGALCRKEQRYAEPPA